MAKTIEELDFKLKIDRSEFDNEIKKANAAAKELNTSLSEYLTLKKNSGNLTNKEYLTLKRLDNLETNRRINADKEAVSAARRAKAVDGMAESQKRYNSELMSQNRLLNEAKNIALSYVSIWGAKKLISELVQVTGEFELQRTTLKAMLQDANGANAIYEQIKQLAVVSPFGFKELVTYTKQLAAYSVPIGELYDTTKMLADVSAGLGVGMDRLVLAYGQVRSAAFLRGQEVRQFTEAGIPILDMLAKQIEDIEGKAISAGEVFDRISKRQISFEMVAKVFKDMTSEGGKFFNMQEIQADTLKGKISNLKDAYEIMMNEIGQGLEPVLKGSVDALRDLMENYEKVGRTILELIAVYGTYRTAMVLAKVASHDLAVTLRLLEINFKRVSKAISSAIFKNPYALIAAGATAAAYAIYKMADGMWGVSDMMENYNRNTEKMKSGVAAETAALDALYAKLEVAKEGTKDYESARKTIYTKYAEYISALNEEGVAVDNLAELYGKLKDKVVEASRERFLRTALQDADEDFSSEIDRIYKKFDKLIGEGVFSDKNLKSATAKQKEALWQYITGGLSLEELEKYVPREWANSVRHLLVQFLDASNEYKKIVAEIGDVAPAFDPNAAISNAPDMTGTEDAYKSEIERLQKRISLLEKLRDVYESMRPYFTDNEIKDFFSTNFGFTDSSLWENFDFDVQINSLVEELDRLGAEGKDAADAIREKLAVALGKDMVDSAKAAVKELDEFNKRVEKFIEEAKTTEQKIQDLENAMASDLAMASTDEQRGAITAHYTAEIEKLKEELLDLTSIQLTDFWQNLTGEKNGTYNYLTNLQNKAKELIELLKNIDPNRDKNGKITGYTLTQDNAGDFLKSIGVDAESLQLTVAQVEALNKAFDKLFSKRASRSGIKTLLDEMGNKNFWANVEEGSSEAISVLEGAEKEFKAIAKAISSIGEAMGSDFVSSIGEGMEVFGDVLLKVAEQDYVGLIVTFTEKFAETVKNIVEARRRMYELRLEVEALNTSAQLSFNTDSIFGSNTYQSLKNAYDVISKVRESISSLEQTLSKITVNQGRAKWWEYLLPGFSTTAWVRLFTNKNVSLTEAIEKMGASLYGEGGRVNIDVLQQLRDKTEGWSKAETEAFDKAILDAQAYNDALDQLDSAMSELVGDISGNFASAIVEQWKAAKNAAADYGDVLSDVAENYAKMIIQDTLLNQIFDDKFKKQITELTKDKKASDVLALFDEKVRELEDYYPYFEELLSGLDQYFTSGTENDTLGNGLKGITEDTANLIASYINAVRADVARGCIQRDEILAEIKNMASYVASTTLLDYMNRIQANTYDTARYNQAILNHIESMMTSEGGFTALRVYQ